MEATSGLALAKWPVKRQTYDGERDVGNVNTWVFTTNEYCTLIQESARTRIPDLQIIRYVSRLFTGTAALWWYAVQLPRSNINQCHSFQQDIRDGLIPEDYERGARDKMRTVKQIWSVSSYASKFRNSASIVPDLNEKENWHRFIERLNPALALEVRK